jgi:hypothetical protein
MRRGLSTYCPACGIDIHFRKLPKRGHHVTCFECKSLLEVIRLAPLTLEWAFEEPFEDDYVDSHDFNYSTDGKNENGYEFDYVDVAEEWEDDWEDDWADDDYDQ